MKTYILKRRLLKIQKNKIKAVKSQLFDRAADYRDKEKMISYHIQKTHKERTMRHKKARSSPWLKEYSLTGCFVQPDIGELPIRMAYYPYAKWLNIYLTSALNELELMKNLWKQMKFKQKTEAKNIIELAGEYHLIDRIFQYLECPDGYFRMDRNQIRTYLDKNPIFNLITLHPKQRESFTINDADSNFRSCYSYDENQYINGFYKKFSYVLPYQCRLTQNGDQVIISSSLFTIYINVKFDFAAYTLPLDFAKYYLGFKKDDGQKVNFHIRYQLKWKMALPWNRKYRKQLKELQKIIEEEVSADHFFKTLKWESIHMQAVITENIIQASKV
jgi:hypothetical protein